MKVYMDMGLSENSSLLGSDDVRGEISKYIFAPNAFGRPVLTLVLLSDGFFVFGHSLHPLSRVTNCKGEFFQYIF